MKVTGLEPEKIRGLHLSLNRSSIEAERLNVIFPNSEFGDCYLRFHLETDGNVSISIHEYSTDRLRKIIKGLAREYKGTVERALLERIGTITWSLSVDREDAQGRYCITANVYTPNTLSCTLVKDIIEVEKYRLVCSKGDKGRVDA